MKKLKIDLDNVVVFHPILVRAFGSINIALFFQQLYFWSDKGKRQDGFIYKTSKEIEKETTLSYYQQKSCQKKLIEFGVLEIKKIKANGAPTLHFKLNIERAQELIDNVQNSKFEKLKNRNSRNSKIHIQETSKSLTESTTKSTTEKKKKIKREKEKPSTEQFEKVRNLYGKKAVGIFMRLNVPFDFAIWAFKNKFPEDVKEPISYLIALSKNEETFAEWQRFKSEENKQEMQKIDLDGILKEWEAERES